MFKKLFIEHPDSVGESYFEHLGMAFSFSFELFGAACACLVHGLVPGLCTTTGSRAISCLHERMVTNRACKAAIATAKETALS